MKSFSFTIHSIIRGGKNAMKVYKGRHYPDRKWAQWRDRIVADLKEILKPTLETQIKNPCKMNVLYVPGDSKRRDMTSMLDSLFHCMERAGLISDDGLIKDLFWTTFSTDRKNPRVEIEMKELDRVL